MIASFKPIITMVTVSTSTKKENKTKKNLISKSSSSIEYGKIISYKNREGYGDYRRI